MLSLGDEKGVERFWGMEVVCGEKGCCWKIVCEVDGCLFCGFGCGGREGVVVRMSLMLLCLLWEVRDGSLLSWLGCRALVGESNPRRHGLG